MSAHADPSSSADAAISHVLGAEQEALAGIAECESRADQTLQDARHAVRQMVRETDERIGRLHAACSDRTREMIRELETGSATADDQLHPDDGEHERLLEAVRAFAQALTTPEQTDGS